MSGLTEYDKEVFFACILEVLSHMQMRVHTRPSKLGIRPIVETPLLSFGIERHRQLAHRNLQSAASRQASTSPAR